ncbi:helix-turn-helix domain-containing protein [Viridibacterium curvum]|uniref:AraC family transcriptional regulator n=1 Tax=Viridibacterium curvum TaxID=1101404 RepID=A0ABP9QFN6_9RHOO
MERRLDTALTLDELAEVAHLSRFHFERVFADYSGETPLARVRRLRLETARRRIAAGLNGGLLDLALDSGYTSAEAFSRAFRSQFGYAPSTCPRAPATTPPEIRITHLDALPIQYIPFEGQISESLRPFDELRARALLQDIPRERRKGWSIEHARNDATGQITLQAALLSDRLGASIMGLVHGALPAGQYAVIALQGRYDDVPGVDELARRVERETGYTVTDGPRLRSFHNASYLPADFEKRWELYLPVQG